MDRRDFFFLQKVQEDELDAAFEGAEDALFNFALDLGFFGIMHGLDVLEQTPTPNLTVRVTGPGAGYDVNGQRVALDATQTVDLAVDSSAVSTAVAAPGNEKIVSLFIEFARDESDPRIDGNSATVNFVQDEGFNFVVAQGAEGPPPAAPPALLPNALLLADVTRTFGQTQIFDADIAAGGAITDRRQDHIVINSTFIDVRTGSFAEALSEMAAAIDAFIVGAAASVGYSGGGNWADGTTNPATNVEAQLDKIITDLATGAGTAKIRGNAIVDAPDSIAAGTLEAQITELLGHINDRLELSGGTLTGDLLPSIVGRDLGSNVLRWDAWIQTLTTVTGLFEGNITVESDILASLDLDSDIGSSTERFQQIFVGTIHGGNLRLDTSITPATMAATENDYNPANIAVTSFAILDPANPGTTLTGIANGSEGRILTIINGTASGFTIAIPGEAAGSSASNRFNQGSSGTGVINLGEGEAATFWYHNSRWRCISATGGI